MESLNRLKAVHEQEVLGERAGAGWAGWVSPQAAPPGQMLQRSRPGQGTPTWRPQTSGPTCQAQSPECQRVQLPRLRPVSQGWSFRWSPKGLARPDCREPITSPTQRGGPSTPRREATCLWEGAHGSGGTDVKSAVCLRDTQAELCPSHYHLTLHSPRFRAWARPS